MQNLSVPSPVHKECQLYQGGNTSHIGKPLGSLRGYRSHPWDEGAVQKVKRDDRANIRHNEGVSRIQVYPDVWQSPEKHESRADIRMHEPQEAGEIAGKEGKTG